MEYWKCLWVVVVAFLLGGSRWWECEGCWEHEKTALLQLKLFFSHIKDVEKYWVEGNQSWDCCEWKRVECNNSTGRVIQLFLYHTSYEDGSLSTDGYNNWYLNASLFLPFKELKSLYLSGNAIAGCVDNQGFERLSSNLDKLEFLDLSNNYLNDSILAFLSELSSLKSLNLGENQFTSSNPIDGIQRLSKLKKLETLDLSDNILLGNNLLSHLTGFTSLKTLRLQSCGLKGTVDMLEFNNLKNLKELYLDENEIESLGSLLQDKEKFRLTKLEVLGLSENLFNNSIFSSTAALSNLKSLYIGYNKLKGSIHIEELNALSNLEELYMQNNEVNEFVPSQDYEMELRLMNLKVLDLSLNLFNNSIFSSFASLSNLESLHLYDNQLEGSIDLKGLHALKNLKELDISCSFAEGAACNLPLQSLGIFTSLKILSLYRVSFNETTTTQRWQNLTNLEELELHDSFFPSNFIQDIGTLVSLKTLRAENCEFNGSLNLHELHSLRNLEDLTISCSITEGIICSLSLQSLKIFSSLKTLSLGGFNISMEAMTIKRWQNLTNLEELKLHDSFFLSNFIQDIGTLVSLKTLHAENCEFNGSLNLHELHSLRNLEDLTISCSTAEGIICSLSLQSLEMFSSLKTLSLGGFNISMEAMTTKRWQNLTNLEELKLHDSSFLSNFIQDIGTLVSLKTLRAENCEFNGSLNLHELHSLRNLEDLTISCSTAEGIICNLSLQSLKMFSSLKTLSLGGFNISMEAMTTKRWQNLTNLEELELHNSSFPSNFIQDIGTLVSLKTLHAKNCEFNGSLNLHELNSLRNLKDLTISCSITEGMVCSLSLQSLEISPSLKTLSLGGVNISMEAMTTKRWQNSTILEELSVKFSSLPSNFIQGFCELRQLQKLMIFNNILKAQLPECFSNLTSLEYLDLSDNQFFGSISVMKSLISLRELRLSNNSFQIPISLGPLFNLSKLEIIYADNNAIYAETERCSLTPTFQLRSISLSCCGHGGSFPQFLYHQHELENVDLSNIYFNGEQFPNWLLENNRKLKMLYLYNNSLLAPFRLPVAPLLGLFYFDISTNSFYGNIPKEIGAKLPSLRILDMSNNYFGGSIPVSIGDMQFLEILDLSNNTLTGGLPKHLAMGNMSSLKEIILANNHLAGPIPMEFCQLNLNLRLLDLSVNNISGSLPSCFSPRWINQVHLSRNKLEGPLTNAFRNSTILATLDLSYNHLTGNIPNWIDKLSQLSYLLLNNNHFEGGIPVQLCMLDHLSVINLSNNRFSGTIPHCLKITTWNDIAGDYYRYVITVAQDRSSLFTKSFPTNKPIDFTIKTMSYHYKGKVLTYLSGIDLSCNNLTGEIPHEVKNFQNIIALNLSHNSLIGPLPPTISDLKQIESLDLSYNKLSGKIPSQLVRLNFLSFFSVAFNNLSGSTPPRAAQFATFEESSYLGNPFLCGTPLQKNCSTDGPASSMPKTSIDDGFIDMNVFYASFVVSYVIVLLTIAIVLYINPYWRRAWFYHIEVGITSCYYFVVDNILPKRFH